MNWKNRYKAMKKGLGYSILDISKITGNSIVTVEALELPKTEIPRWLKLAIVIFEKYNPKK